MSAVIKMNEEERRIEQFNDVMANAKPMITEGKGRSLRTITASACVPLSICFVDPRYQGMRSHKRLNRLDLHFDKRKLAPITLVPHYEEYRFAVVDGQGRTIVAPRKGMDRLFATILMDAPEDPVERLKFEAEYFIGQDSEIEPVSSLEKHLARVIIGDPTATTLDKLLKRYDIKFTQSPGNRKESVLGSYPTTYEIAKRGEKCLDFIFSIIKNAGWNHEKNGYGTFVMIPLERMWVEHSEDRERIDNFLSDYLRQINPSIFNTEAKVTYPKRDNRAACTLHLEDILCESLGIERKIYPVSK